ncbi:MAG TPA: hypothetical protein VF735_06600 [Pyrinomonadaceae bacterium]|jgi:hypothetical protein
MAFAEDLTQFFDTEEFAVVAALKQSNGTVIRNANVIFNDPNQDAQMFAETVEADAPFIIARSVDVSDMKDGYKVTIGATTYRVIGTPHQDGTGISTVKLKP